MSSLESIREHAAARGLIASGDFLQKVDGITFRQLDYWCRACLLEYEDGDSSGVPRMFAPQEVAVAELLGRLSACGLAPSSDLARRAAEVARHGGDDVVTEGPLSVFVA